MEAVRILQSLGIKPRRTIRIGLWTGEEQGLLGSRGYVDAHFGKRIDPERRPSPSGSGGTAAPGGPGGAAGSGPGGGDQANAAPPRFELKPEQTKISGYFNLDNGTGKVRGVYLQGNDAIAAIFREWLKPFRDMGAATLTLENTGGTDHLSFDAVGIPGFQFIQDPIEYGSRTHHSNMDVYDRIQEEDMKQAATIMAAFVYNTAMRDEPLPRKPLPGQVGAPAGGR
jgi:Zn-dependent M28 family amino/carboxypeptidase